MYRIFGSANASSSFARSSFMAMTSGLLVVRCVGLWMLRPCHRCVNLTDPSQRLAGIGMRRPQEELLQLGLGHPLVAVVIEKIRIVAEAQGLVSVQNLSIRRVDLDLVTVRLVHGRHRGQVLDVVHRR